MNIYQRTDQSFDAVLSQVINAHRSSICLNQTVSQSVETRQEGKKESARSSVMKSDRQTDTHTHRERERVLDRCMTTTCMAVSFLSTLRFLFVCPFLSAFGTFPSLLIAPVSPPSGRSVGFCFVSFFLAFSFFFPSLNSRTGRREDKDERRKLLLESCN